MPRHYNNVAQVILDEKYTMPEKKEYVDMLHF